MMTPRTRHPRIASHLVSPVERCAKRPDPFLCYHHIGVNIASPGPTIRRPTWRSFADDEIPDSRYPINSICCRGPGRKAIEAFIEKQAGLSGSSVMHLELIVRRDRAREIIADRRSAPAGTRRSCTAPTSSCLAGIRA